MALTDAQIERYSRQIVLPQVGGRGQKRLLSSRLLIAGETSDIELTLAYIVAAGVGTIQLEVFDRVAASGSIERMRELNPDVALTASAETAPSCDLMLLFIGSRRMVAKAATVNSANRQAPIICARLSNPDAIALIPRRPPCLACTDAMLAEFGKRSGSAEIIALVAATEALKHLLSPAPHPALIQFTESGTSCREIAVNQSCATCSGG